MSAAAATARPPSAKRPGAARSKPRRHSHRPPAPAAVPPAASSPQNGDVHFVEPMLALALQHPPAGAWRFEIKSDGFRALGRFGAGKAALWSRRHNEISDRFPEVRDALAQWEAGPALVDGEIVALEADGRSSFQLLQQAGSSRTRPPVFYYVFDLLWHRGAWLLERPLEERQHLLQQLCHGAPEAVRLSTVFDTPATELLAHARRHGLEGIVGKAVGSPYQPGRRSGLWCKLRLAHDQEFVIAGYTPPQGSRACFGALLLGYYEGSTLRYAGKVGTGFSESRLAELQRKFSGFRAARSAFAEPPREARNATWLRPELVAQIRFSEWTDGGSLRQPVFLGLREDKPARAVVREPSAAT